MTAVWVGKHPLPPTCHFCYHRAFMYLIGTNGMIHSSILYPIHRTLHILRTITMFNPWQNTKQVSHKDRQTVVKKYQTDTFRWSVTIFSLIWGRRSTFQIVVILSLNKKGQSKVFSHALQLYECHSILSINKQTNKQTTKISKHYNYADDNKKATNNSEKEIMLYNGRWQCINYKKNGGLKISSRLKRLNKTDKVNHPRNKLQLKLHLRKRYDSVSMEINGYVNTQTLCRQKIWNAWSSVYFNIHRSSAFRIHVN